MRADRLGHGVSAVAVLLLWNLAAGADDPPTLDDLRGAIAEGRAADAEAGARTLLAGLDRAGKAETAAAAALLDVLVESLWRGGKGQEPEALALAERNVALKQRILPGDGAGLGKSLNNLAVIAFFAGDYPRARSTWEQAIAVRETALGPEHPDVAESLNGLANLYQPIADYGAALPLYRRALAIREKAYGPDHARVGQSLNNLSALLTSMGDYAGALPLAERSLRIKERTLGPDHPLLVSTMTNLGWVLAETPLTPATRGMIGARGLALMKPDAVLINTARGALVDAAALAAALRSGRLGGAGIHVLEQEPPVDGNPLLEPAIPNLIVTPHTAWAARESRQRCLDELAANVTASLRGERRNRVD